MSDYEDYITEDSGYQGNGNGYQGNGYDQLAGDWALFYKVASRFIYSVKPNDKEDFLHDLLLKFATVKATYDTKGKELTEGGLMRVAQYELADYWHRRFKRINGINCKQCSKSQREKCKDWFMYPDCPRAVNLERLDKLVEDDKGDSTPLYELIADDKAVDLVAMVDAKLTLGAYPRRFVQLAYKKYAGYPFTSGERTYYYRELKKVQKSLV